MSMGDIDTDSKAPKSIGGAFHRARHVDPAGNKRVSVKFLNPFNLAVEVGKAVVDRNRSMLKKDVRHFFTDYAIHVRSQKRDLPFSGLLSASFPGWFRPGRNIVKLRHQGHIIESICAFNHSHSIFLKY